MILSYIMNHTKSIITIIVLTLQLSACTKKQASSVIQEGIPYFHTPDFTPIWLFDKAQLDTLHIITDFKFKNQNGETISSETFKGKVHVANFFFTICPSLCPKIMGNMKIIQDSLQHDKNFLIASYSVMPDRDSVAMLRKYATENQIIDNKWHLLTGDKKQIYELARKSYFADENLGVQKGENDFLHTENFILVDKNLHIRGIYNGTLQLEIEQLIKDIRELEKE
jgi:protein SCO1